MNITDVRIRKISDDGKMSDGAFRDVAHPICSEVRNQIKEQIFQAYEKMLTE